MPCCALRRRRRGSRVSRGRRSRQGSLARSAGRGRGHLGGGSGRPEEDAGGRELADARHCEFEDTVATRWDEMALEVSCVGVALV